MQWEPRKAPPPAIPTRTCHHHLPTVTALGPPWWLRSSQSPGPTCQHEAARSHPGVWFMSAAFGKPAWRGGVGRGGNSHFGGMAAGRKSQGEPPAVTVRCRSRADSVWGAGHSVAPAPGPILLPQGLAGKDKPKPHLKMSLHCRGTLECSLGTAGEPCLSFPIWETGQRLGLCAQSCQQPLHGVREPKAAPRGEVLSAGRCAERRACTLRPGHRAVRQVGFATARDERRSRNVGR